MKIITLELQADKQKPSLIRFGVVLYKGYSWPNLGTERSFFDLSVPMPTASPPRLTQVNQASMVYKKVTDMIIDGRARHNHNGHAEFNKQTTTSRVFTQQD
jgi:hypothetical protein